MTTGTQRGIDESAAGLRIEKLNDFVQQDRCVSPHHDRISDFGLRKTVLRPCSEIRNLSPLDPQLAQRFMVVLGERLVLYPAEEPFMIPNIQMIQITKDSDFSRHLGRFTQQRRNQNPA